jgi:hypothetical protein
MPAQVILVAIRIKMKGDSVMAKNEQTGKKAGTAASKVLRGSGTKKDAETAAGSALSQRPDKKKSGK